MRQLHLQVYALLRVKHVYHKGALIFDLIEVKTDVMYPDASLASCSYIISRSSTQLLHCFCAFDFLYTIIELSNCNT